MNRGGGAAAGGEALRIIYTHTHQQTNHKLRNLRTKNTQGHHMPSNVGVFGSEPGLFELSSFRVALDLVKTKVFVGRILVLRELGSVAHVLLCRRQPAQERSDDYTSEQRAAIFAASSKTSAGCKYQLRHIP